MRTRVIARFGTCPLLLCSFRENFRCSNFEWDICRLLALQSTRREFGEAQPRSASIIPAIVGSRFTIHIVVATPSDGSASSQREADLSWKVATSSHSLLNTRHLLIVVALVSGSGDRRRRHDYYYRDRDG